MRPRSDQVAGVLLVSLSSTCFAAATITAKLAFRSGAGVGTLVLARLTFGAAVLWGAIAVLRLRPRVPPGRRRPLVWMGLLSAAVAALLFGAVARIPASTATLLLYAHPPLIAAIAIGLRRERSTPAKMAALALGLAGVGLVLGAPVQRLAPTGVAMALGAAVALALYVVAAQPGARGLRPAAVGAVVLTVAAAAYAPFAALNVDLGRGRAWLWMLLAGALSGTAIAVFLAALARLGPIRSSIGATVEPVMAVVLATLFLGESLSGIQLAGGALVVAAVAMLPLAGRPVGPGEIAPLARPEHERRGASSPRR